MKPIILVIAILSLLLARNTAFPLSNHRIDSQKRHLVVTANSYEEAVHIASKCLLGIDMTVAEWKTMYDKITTYIGKNWDDPYLHGQAAVFVATIAIPVTKLSKFSKLNLLNRLKANTKFADKVDDLAKISKVADEGGDVGKVVDDLNKLKIPKLGEKLNVSEYATSTKNSVKDLMTPDHIPSYASTRKYLESKLGRELTVDEARKLNDEGTTLLYETEIHQKFSRTYGGRNSAEQILNDSKGLFEAAKKDLEALRQPLIDSGMTNEEINQAFDRIHEMNRNKGLY